MGGRIRCPKGWHTIADVASMWGVSVSAVRNDIKLGRLRAIVPRLQDKGMIVSDDELARYMREEFEEVAR